MGHDYEKRVKQLEAQSSAESWYPRLQPSVETRWTVQKYREELDFLEPNETMDDGDTFTVAGMETGSGGVEGTSG